ncbi:MAG TPA: enoyl-CoA hydratase/isomerase family protein [Ramlibacter sp.]|nr:enoyl-CoA hydratase/isomerase family protein [Ramlibacter sp.]
MNTTHLTIEDHVATLEFDHPPNNRLSRGLMGAFEEAIAEIRRSGEVRAVVLCGRGQNFSHGGDISIWPGVSPQEMAVRVAASVKRANLLEDLPIPTIAAVQGDCLGGGFEYALRCDVIIAAEGARFAHTEQSLGVFTLLGGVQRVAERSGRARAMKWALTSERVSAEELLEAGVVTEVVPADELAARAQDWARRLADGPTLAHAAHKRLLREWASGGIAAADRAIPELAEQIFASADAQRGVASGLDALARGIQRPVLKFEGR